MSPHFYDLSTQAATTVLERVVSSTTTFFLYIAMQKFGSSFHRSDPDLICRVLEQSKLGRARTSEGQGVLSSLTTAVSLMSTNRATRNAVVLFTLPGHRMRGHQYGFRMTGTAQ